MRGYYLHYRDIRDELRVQTGIDRKVAAQIAALNRADLNCEFRFCPQPETTSAMVASCLPFLSDGIRWPDPKSLADADYLYIRRPRFASRELIRFLKGFRALNPDALAVYEVPSYPYDREMSSPKLRLALAKDRRWRRELASYVSYAGDLTGSSELFGMPTVQLFNGVDLGTILPRRPSFDSHGPIDIACAAYFEPWHGIDRLIRGLAEYRAGEPVRSVRLHLAGGGSQLPVLKGLAARLGVEDCVEFLGPLGPDVLDGLYDRCTLGVEVLGAHRKGDPHFVSSSLKSREYLAKGMPFIYACDIDFLLREPADFCMRIPDDDSPVSIRDVVAFHNRLYGSCDESDLIARIRAYGERHVSIDAAMGKVIDLIKGHCS